MSFSILIDWHEKKIKTVKKSLNNTNRRLTITLCGKVLCIRYRDLGEFSSPINSTGGCAGVRVPPSFCYVDGDASAMNWR